MTVVDGRVERGARNRQAIVEALVACYHDGLLRPSAAEVARRAGVSARSVHNHFDDMEALRGEVARRQGERFATAITRPDPAAPLAGRIDHVAGERAALFEQLTPVRRAALLSVHDSPTIARYLAIADRSLRRQIERAFAPELDGAPRHLLDAVDAAASWDTWNRLRTAQGCSVARARAVLVTVLHALLERPHAEGNRP